jgi:hypothetical protein
MFAVLSAGLDADSRKRLGDFILKFLLVFLRSSPAT